MPELIFEAKKGSTPVSDIERIRAAVKNIPGGKQILITKKFIDARHGKAKIVLRYELLSDSELREHNDSIINSGLPYKDRIRSKGNNRPVVVGFGPAGIFASLILARYGLNPIVIERGSDMATRVKDIEEFRKGIALLKSGSNVQYGEGGAGTFSDGKLYSGISSGLKEFVSDVFIEHGADPSILYDAHPHIGTDRLRDIIVSIREEIKSLGGTVLFDTHMDGIVVKDGAVQGVEITDGSGTRIIDCDRIILAVGNSSRDTFRYLDSHGVAMEPKPFAVGVRIEHPRSAIDIAQYGIDTQNTGDLSAANYKLAVDTATGRKLYTFCMCPGGEVINASSGPQQAVVNGMSYSKRDLCNSNSALLVPVDRNDYGEGVLDGIRYQEELEKKAFIAGGSDGSIPVSTYGMLREGKISSSLGSISPSIRPQYKIADLHDIFDPVITDTITDGIAKMGRKIKGFDTPDACLSAVESRSSSPVRILRDRESRESISIRGLYPAGEGAGYAGGIMSSAIDGINCANSLAKCYIN